MTLYADLGLEPGATPDEIAAAHRAAAKRTHPDTGGDRDEFERVQRAAMILRDPTKRARYDQTGDAGDKPDNSLSDLTAMLTSAFDRAMQQDGWHHRDVIAQTKQFLQSDMAQQEQQRRLAAEAKEITGKALARLKFRGKGRAMINSVLEERMRNLDHSMMQMDARIELMKTAIAMADDYDWEHEAPPKPFWTQPNWTSKSTTVW